MEKEKEERNNNQIKKRSSSKRNERKEKKVDVGYIRVVGIKKDKEIFLHINKKYENIPASSGSSSIMHLFSGEKKEVYLFILLFLIISSYFLLFPLVSSYFFVIGKIYEIKINNI